MRNFKMKRVLSFLVSFFIVYQTSAQYTVRLVVNEAATKQLDDWYISGTFNNWNPKDEAFKLKPFGNKRKAVVLKNLPAGNIAFKFTRGSWDKVETMANGINIDNREIKVSTDTVATYNVAGWKDDFPDKPKPITASPQVAILDSAFYMPQLNRTRRIWVYLPKSYATSKTRFPVLYMHDGQNLFSDHTAFAGEWGIDESLDAIEKSGGKSSIVIGIDNGGEHRMSEYNPYDTKQNKGEGALYIQFIAETLKPFIDKKFRTLKDSANTFIAGSSMGGLISLYALNTYPKIFGAAGIFSPALWVAPEILNHPPQGNVRSLRRYYFYAGGNESATLVRDMDKMIALIETKKNYETQRVVNPLGKHEEAAWRKEFPQFYKWLMRN